MEAKAAVAWHRLRLVKAAEAAEAAVKVEAAEADVTNAMEATVEASKAMDTVKANEYDPGRILHPSKIHPATLARVQAICELMRQ